MSTFIANTPLAHMRALGSVAERSHSRITSILPRHFSEEYAAFLAEPVPSPDGSGIDWFVDSDAGVRPLADLSEEEANGVRVRLDDMIGKVRAEIEHIEDSGDANRQALANALRNAITIPGEEYIWAMKTQEGGYLPLLIGWGYTSHETTAKERFDVTARGQVLRGVRAGQDARPQPSDAQPVNPAATATPEGAAARSASAPILHSLPIVHVRDGGGFWARWLIPLLLAIAFLLMLALLVSYLLPACGMRTPFGTIVFGWLDRSACIQNANAAPGNLTVQTITLERELDVLKENFERRRGMCRLPQMAEEEVEVPPSDDFAIEERGKAQVTLEWSSVDDLDLSVICPNGQRIKYNAPHGCGGNLDIDANGNGQKMRNPPGENITFEQGLPQSGPYRVLVTHFKSRTNRYPVKFRVRIRDGSGETRTLEGELARQKQTVEIGTMQP